MLHKCANPALSQFCFAVSTSASSFYLLRIVPWQGIRNLTCESQSAVNAPGGALLVMRWLFLTTHPHIGTWERNGYSSASG